MKEELNVAIYSCVGRLLSEKRRPLDDWFLLTGRDPGKYGLNDFKADFAPCYFMKTFKMK